MVIDIGSGSVGAAIVSLGEGELKQPLIWSYRERMPAKTEATESEAEKRIATTVMNVFLELGSNGLKTLRASGVTAEIKRVQVAISSPWCYTVTRTIHMQAERPFKVTHELLDELIDKASDQAKSHINQNLVVEKLSLTTLSDSTVNISENGYVVHKPFKDNIKKLSVSQLMAMSSQNLYKAIEAGAEKVIPEAKVVTNTFVYFYYRALANLYSETAEACLIDVTSEATELGIIRRGVLEGATHIKVGTSTLAREIAAATNMTAEEGLGYLRQRGGEATRMLKAEHQTKVDEIVMNYENKLVELFQRTGDALSLPRTIFLHTDHRQETFLHEVVKRAAKKATETEHSIHLVTSKFFAPEGSPDSALLLSAYVLRNRLYEPNYFKWS